MKYKILFVMFLFASELFAIDDLQKDTLKYGTDNEIATLIKTLKKDNDDTLDNELSDIVHNTKNPVIKSLVISFFTERGKKGLEEESVYLIENRDGMETSNILSAIEYLGKIKYENAQSNLRSLLESDEELYKTSAIRAIGKATGPDTADNTAEYLIEYYNKKEVTDENKREIIASLGETGSKKASPFLSEIIKDNEKQSLTIASILALSSIKDEETIEIIIECVQSKDPNIRSAAIESLGSFKNSEADKAIIDAFRDSYYKTRLAAIKAVREKKSADAVPYLKFRAENDEVPAVKEEAIRALGEIGNSETESILEGIFNDKKMPDKNRVLAAQMLIKIDASKYADAVIARIDESKRLNQKQTYNSLLSVISKAKTDKVKDLTRRLFDSKDAVEKSFAIELSAINNFSSFAPLIEKIAEENNSGLSRRAKEVLEKLN
jgi:HEAT repeat protein